MGEQAHTAGPWVWRHSDDGTPERLVEAAGASVLVAEEHHGYAWCEVSEANARLIASAPDLLEALKALYASYKELADSGDAGFWSLEDTDEGKQALAAIQRATGGES